MNVELHPKAELLRDFAVGRGDEQALAEVEQHLAQCAACCRVVQGAEEDRLVALARQAVVQMGSLADTQPRMADGGTLGAGNAPADIDVQGLAKAFADHPRYQLLEPLGRGGMGVVYKARHLQMGRTVALKLIHPHLTAHADAIARFQQESSLAARLLHPNVVTAFDADQTDGQYFLAMEFVPGQDLSRLVQQRGPLPVAEACDLIRQAAIGLQHAHEKGLIHRDIKPQNLIRTPDGVVKILDFGLARLQESASPRAGSQSDLTRAEQVVGTPDYVAPEQADVAGRVDQRADLYSLGCTLYFLLAGRVPFPADSASLKLASHLLREPTPVTAFRSDLPPALVQLIARLLAKQPQQRVQSAAEVADLLAGFSCSAPPAPPAELTAVAADRSAAPISAGTRPAAHSPAAQSETGRAGWGRRHVLAAVCGGGLALLGIVLLFVWVWPNKRPNRRAGGNRQPSRAQVAGTQEDSVHVLFLLAPDEVWYEDFGPVYDRLKQQGVEVRIASSRPTITIHPESHPTLRTLQADQLLEDVNVAHHDILVICGGDVSDFCDIGPHAATVGRLIRQHLANRMFVAAICQGQRVLASAGVLRGVVAAKPPLTDTWHTSGGAQWRQQPLVVSDQIITAADPDAADAFANQLLRLLGRLPQ